MKNFNFKFKKTVQALLLALLVIPLVSQCKKEKEPEPPKSSDKEMKDVNISAGGVTFSAELQTDGKTFYFAVPYVVNGEVFDQNKLATATVTFTLSKGAKSDPISGATVDLTADKTFTVTAEDESTKDYVIKKGVIPYPEKEFKSFIVYLKGEEVRCEIDKVTFTVWIPRPAAEDMELLENLAPTFTLSLGATANPQTGEPQDFSDTDNPVTYVITAQDGSTQTWTVKITNRSDADIAYFAIDFYMDEQPPNTGDGVPRGEISLSSFSADRDGNVYIDKENGIITYDLPMMPDWFDASKMYVCPTFIDFSPGWQKVEPNWNEKLDFSKDVVYTVTAENGETKEWTVKAPKYYMKKKWEVNYRDLDGSLTDPSPQNANSIAIIDDYLSIGRTPDLLNKSDGTIAGTVLNVTDIWKSQSGDGDMTPTSSLFTRNFPFFTTNDDAGNMIGCNLNAWGTDNFVVYKWTSPTADPVVVMEFPTKQEVDDGEGNVSMVQFVSLGRKLQVLGDINGKGLIIAPTVDIAGNDASNKGIQYIWKINGGIVDVEHPVVVETNIHWTGYAYQLLTPLGLEPEGPYYVGSQDGAETYPNLQFGNIGNTDKIFGPFEGPAGVNATANKWGNGNWLYQKLFTFDGKDMIATFTSSSGTNYYYYLALLKRNADNTHETFVPAPSMLWNSAKSDLWPVIPWDNTSCPNGNGTGSFAMEKVGDDILFYIFPTNRGVFCWQLSKL